jgi:hypothetical protein
MSIELNKFVVIVNTLAMRLLWTHQRPMKRDGKLCKTPNEPAIGRVPKHKPAVECFMVSKIDTGYKNNAPTS